ncbi:MAG: glutamate-5-semialdehyde dehydrogenase [Heliobacteriaceae bacterium]|jgi:glutamate-5-semialdehyde dehydrogenase|nr:glutamate-5-semialdehyde dehydrogenase [Heliobacteriaceae bacterium]
MDFIKIAKQAKEASFKIAGISTETKNRAVLMMANAIEGRVREILAANHKDLTEAEKLMAAGKITKAAFSRLKFDEDKIHDMVSGIRNVAGLDDPINQRLLVRQLDTDLTLFKISCPIGVMGIIFEARPDVIAQIAALAVKSSNTVILKGGTEAKHTNKTILNIINSTLDKLEGFPKNVLQQVFSRDDVTEMLKCSRYIDLIIPRGSNSLVKFIKENTRIPVLGHSDGICHIFVDKNADLTMAKEIVIDSKTQYPSACNSVETLLIHKDFPYKEELLDSLSSEGIELINNPESWSFEYSDKILAYKTVKSLDEAINHINTYGSGHTDCIVTNDAPNAEEFMDRVDSAGVYTNVSTRFADGYRYGFGAEVGISTNKTHARGPVGLEGLTIYKYKLVGAGQVVKDYVGGVKQFRHQDLALD